MSMRYYQYLINLTMKGVTNMNRALVYGEPIYKVKFKNPISYYMNKGDTDKYIRRMLPLPSGIKILKDNLNIIKL